MHLQRFRSSVSSSSCSVSRSTHRLTLEILSWNAANAVPTNPTASSGKLASTCCTSGADEKRVDQGRGVVLSSKVKLADTMLELG